MTEDSPTSVNFSPVRTDKEQDFEETKDRRMSEDDEDTGLNKSCCGMTKLFC